MKFKAGDRIEVTSNALGVAPRHGAVIEATAVGTIRVQWDDGHESVFMPSSNCRVLSSSSSDTGDEASMRLGCHIDVVLVENGQECKATASVMTSRGMFEGEGIARLKPGDTQVPRIGEELAMGRALAALSERLLSAANVEISEHPSDQGHLVG